MKDWFEALEVLGFRKHSYSKEQVMNLLKFIFLPGIDLCRKETHFHGLCLVKVRDFDDVSSVSESFYIMQDKHEIDEE